MISRTHEIEKEVDSLVQDAKVREIGAVFMTISVKIYSVSVLNY